MPNEIPEEDVICEEAEGSVKNILNKFSWIPNKLNRDRIATDFHVSLSVRNGNKCEVAPADVYVQVKGTRSPSISDGYVSISIENKHVDTWRQRPLPVVLVVYNVEEKVGYWRFVRELTCAPGKNSQRIKIPIANTLDESNRARLEDLILLEVWSSVRDRFPTVREMSAAQRREIFPHSLAELPRPFVDGDRFDVLVVTGPTRYDLEKLEARFIKANDGFQDEKLGNKIELGDSAYNLSLCSEILSALSFQAGHRQCVLTAERRQLTYLEVNETTLANHNLILLPCGDVNPVLPLAIKRFEMKYRVTCPVHHDPKIESSEGIFDQLTRTRYSKGRDDQGVGFVALLPNPWNEDKAMLLCGGNKGVGTQAALLRVLMAIRGDRKLIDREGIPTAIVRGEFDRSTLFVTGVEDIT